jgi:hypothetical protein
MITAAIIFFYVAPLLLAFYVLFALLPSFAMDDTRSRLFAIRSQLFEMGVDGRLDFKSPAYRMTRDLLNGSIRYAHDCSVVRLLMLRFTFGKNRPQTAASFENEFSRAKQNLPEATRKELESLHRKTSNVMLRHVLVRSVLCQAVILVVYASVMLRWALLHAVNVGQFIRRAWKFLGGRAVRDASEVVLRSQISEAVQRRWAPRIEGESLKYVVDPGSAHVRHLCHMAA